LRHEIRRTVSVSQLQSALGELIESIRNFNRRWADFARSVDLTALNKLREGYNLYYVFEKECAVRSSSVARQCFRPLEMLTYNHILARFPFVTVPERNDPGLQ